MDPPVTDQCGHPTRAVRILAHSRRPELPTDDGGHAFSSLITVPESGRDLSVARRPCRAHAALPERYDQLSIYVSAAMNDSHEAITQVADGLAAAIATLAALSQPDDVAVRFLQHLNALAVTCPDDKPMTITVLELVAGHLGELIDD